MAAKRPDKVTITEVARLAGVSTATAGRVLGGYGYSSEEIKKRVQASAKRLGYRPNLLARGLITGKTKTIGVVAGDIQSPFYSSILRGIADVSRAEGFGVLLTNSDELLVRELEAVQLLLDKQVDGLIVAPCDTERSDHLRRALKEGCPIVQFDRMVKGLGADAVTVDNRKASREAIGSLIEAGHRRIAILAELERWDSGDIASFIMRVEAGSIEPTTLFPSWQRLFGYVEAHLAAGLKIDRALVARVGAYSLDAARLQALHLLREADRPTALFTADGLMTAGAVDAITSLGLRIPDELSMIGFDDLDWMSFLKPAITAVVQPVTAMGETAARLMLDRLAGGDSPPRHVTLELSLARRGSVAKP
ncbi:MAG: LacI family transcriptional regulator [Alphaproteobacteria bacterium]|nr:MAG: LacI family transcriptional regulator [Alphaproteobacteria bacterium]